MALKNYTTSISVEKTLSEIQGKLAYVGAKRIMTEYDDTGNVELRRKIEVIGNIHENPELLEEK